MIYFCNGRYKGNHNHHNHDDVIIDNHQYSFQGLYRYFLPIPILTLMMPASFLQHDHAYFHMWVGKAVVQENGVSRKTLPKKIPNNYHHRGICAHSDKMSGSKKVEKPISLKAKHPVENHRDFFLENYLIEIMRLCINFCHTSHSLDELRRGGTSSPMRMADVWSEEEVLSMVTLRRVRVQDSL